MNDHHGTRISGGALGESVWARPMSRRQFMTTAGIVAGTLAAGSILSACGEDEGPSPAPAASTGTMVRGGTLRVGLVGLSTTDSRDPAAATTAGGYALARQLFNSLMVYGPDGSLVPSLAEEVSAVSGDEWVVRLRDAEWHDGKPVTAEDVIFTFQRILDPDDPLPNASAVAFIDAGNMKKEDDKTVRFHLTYPTVTFADAMASPLQSIVPVGFDPANPVGSGAFMLDQFSPGERYTFKRFESFWAPGEPRVDELVLIGFPDSSAEVNALIGGQVDVAPGMDAALVRVVEAAGEGFVIDEYESTATLCWQMHCGQKPFDNVSVRQALRLAVDRPGIVERVYDGHASIGNDLFNKFDSGYAVDISQRERDPEQSLALLKQAGYDRVAVELTGAPVAATANKQNEALVSQAKEGGFDITFRKVDVATYYGESYGTYPLSLSFWGNLSILDQAALTVVEGSPYNATKWSDTEFDALYEQALAEPDDAKRHDLMRQMQQIQWERGSYVVAQFQNTLTGYSSKVAGYQPAPMGEPASDYGFRQMGFTS